MTHEKTTAEQYVWDLLEGDCLPSEVERTHRAYIAVLAAAWDAGADASWSAIVSGHHYPDNPYGDNSRPNGAV